MIYTCRSRPGIFVHYLVPGSKAEECGSIRAGDRMLEVNGKDLRDVTVDEAAALMMVSGVSEIVLEKIRGEGKE